MRSGVNRRVIHGLRGSPRLGVTGKGGVSVKRLWVNSSTQLFFMENSAAMVRVAVFFALMIAFWLMTGHLAAYASDEMGG